MVKSFNKRVCAKNLPYKVTDISATFPQFVQGGSTTTLMLPAYSYYPCQSKVVIKENGQWWCALHAPSLAKSDPAGS